MEKRLMLKRIYTTSYYTLLGVLAATLFFSEAKAQGRDDDFEPGLSGYLQLMVGGGTSESIADVSDDTKTIYSLDQGADSESSLGVRPMYKLAYTLENGATQFYVGTPEENFVEGNFLFEVGAKQKLAGGTILGLAWIPDLPLIDSEVWEDPFLLGSERQETDQDTQAFKLTAESIMGSPLTLRYGYGFRDIDDEMSGTYLASLPGSTLTRKDLDSLNRESDYHFFQAMYAFRLENGFTIRPQFGYLIGDADGDANSFDSYSGEISFFYPMQRWMLFGNLSVVVADYDAENPVFNETREDTTFGVNFGVGYREPFGFENWSVNLFTRYEQNDSNITFYDSTDAMAGVGLAWRF